MNRVVQRNMIVPNMHLLELEAPEIASKIRPGQFVIVRPDEEGERVPLSVADWDKEKGTITIIFMEVGASTGQLASLKPGDTVPTCVGPLGNATEIAQFGTVMLVAGCYGIGSIYPVARELKNQGNKVLAVIEARSSFLLYWLDKFVGLSDRIFSITRDGSQGYQGACEPPHRDHQWVAEPAGQDHRQRVYLPDGPYVGDHAQYGHTHRCQPEPDHDRRDGHVRGLPRDRNG